ncbi:MAG TPA: Ku protein [Methylomirabilota bacterium]|nr:Ku protein [Methylomirabilota bacterium]
MAQKIWTGSIGFGLVNIPVSVLPGESREELDFTLLDERDMSPIGYRKVSKRTGKEVPRNRIVRGFEYAKGRYVLVTDADLRRASPERTRRIDILAFTDHSEVDPRYYDRPYYLEPAAGGEKGYALFREALQRTGKIAIATVVMRTRQYLAAVIARDSVLVLDLLRYPSELRDPGKLALPSENLKRLGISGKEVGMAERLVDEMAAPWDPSKYRDEYQDELMSFIKKRAKTGEVEEVEEPPKPKKGEVIDIMDLLKRSVDRAGDGRARHRRRKAG